MDFMDLVVLVIFIVVCFAIYKAYNSIDKKPDKKSIEILPASVKSVFNKMSKTEQDAFLFDYQRKEKSIVFSYILWIFTLHYAYNKKIGLQFVFWLTLGGFFIWWFIDLLRMPSIVNEANDQIAREIVQTLSLGKSFSD